MSTLSLTLVDVAAYLSTAGLLTGKSMGKLCAESTSVATVGVASGVFTVASTVGCDFLTTTGANGLGVFNYQYKPPTRTSVLTI